VLALTWILCELGLIELSTLTDLKQSISNLLIVNLTLKFGLDKLLELEFSPGINLATVRVSRLNDVLNIFRHLVNNFLGRAGHQLFENHLD